MSVIGYPDLPAADHAFIHVERENPKLTRLIPALMNSRVTCASHVST